MKLTLYWRYATRSLRRGGQRTIFAIFCVAIGVLVIVALQLVGNMVARSIAGNIRAFNGGDIAVHTEYHDLTHLQLDYFATLQAQGRVSAYSPMGGTCATAETPAASNQRICIDTVDPATYPLGGPLTWITPPAGSLSALLGGEGAVATQGLARQLHASVGTPITFTTDDGRRGTLTITGIVANSGFLESRPELLVADSTYTALPSVTGSPEGYTWIFVNVPGHSDALAANVAESIGKQFPLATTMTVPQAERSAQEEISAVDNFLEVVGLLALLIGGVGIINTMQVLLRRRALEIAMLKTVGYRRVDLVLMFGTEAALLGLCGGVVGAAGGVGMSFAVQALLDNALFLTVPAVIDPPIVAAGVGIGVATTLIFGLLPIVQASTVRPLAVLRETQEPRDRRAVLTSALLLVVLGFLFFLLAAAILGNPLLAAGVVAGAGLLLVLATFFFAGLAWLISALPVHDRPRFSSVALVALLAAFAFLVLRASLGFGVLVAMVVVAAVCALVLPRTAKAQVRLGLRNIGRARLRSASTLVALFAGVFAIGVGLALGQGLKDALTHIATNVPTASDYVIATSADAPTVAQQLATAQGITSEQINLVAPDRIVAVNGVPIARALPPGTTSGGIASQVGLTVSGVEGYDLANGHIPRVTLVPGVGKQALGRTLTASDATTANALFPPNYSQAPLNLKLGDSLTVADLNGTASVMLHVAGFYDAPSGLSLEPVIADTHVVHALTSAPYTVYALRLDPTQEANILNAIHRAAPNAITVGIGALLQQLSEILDNVVQVVESVAALALLAGLIMIANSVALAMLERRREIGILKSLGYASRSVLAMVLIENVTLAFASALLAMLLVSLLTVALESLVFKHFVGEAVAPAQVLALVLGPAAMAGVVAGAVAWASTRVRPMTVLRYE